MSQAFLSQPTAIMPLLPYLIPLLLQFSSSFLITSAYFPPNKYFLNCGSESDVTFGGTRKFIGDAKPGPWSINPGKSKSVRNETNIPKSINEIYHTARVYNQPTWYVFESINQNSTYVVRLHFLALTSQSFLQARFNVSASNGFQLLSKFSIQSSDLSTPIVKEFAFEIKKGVFGIQFCPHESSLAFVNAIEVFEAPEAFKPESGFVVSPQLNTNDNFMYMITSEAFQAVYRVSMGGPLVTPDMDPLWRTWLPDEGFMTHPSPAKNVTFKEDIKYYIVTTIYTAPSSVYSHAKSLDMNSTKTSKDPNITWVFKVKKTTRYFIRFHFCDIIEPRSTPFRFDYFLDVNRTHIDSEEVLSEFGKPFWFECIIVTDRTGYFNVGIAHTKEAPLSKAFMNGVEIMELIEKSFVGSIDLKPKEDKHNQKWIIIGVCVGGVVIIALIIGLALFYLIRGRKSRKHRPLPLPQNDPSEKVMSMADLAPNLNIELKISLDEIIEGTNGFDEKKVIGVGGFGRVYVGTIGGKEVAVKRSRPGLGQGLKEFQTEIIILSQIRHRYLVSLCGYCNENEEMILVYEYMAGGTLKDYLYGSKIHDHLPLSWKQRLQICIDAAKGLDYLHIGSTFGVIIHRDIKTTNILLDKDNNAKVADFGISKAGVPDAKALDATVKGTFGYLDPEYLNTFLLTEKSDVYSFGVVLFEVLFARPPIVKTLPSEQINLADWAILCNKRGEIEKVIDPFLVGTIEANSLRKFVEIAEKCVDEVGTNRPSMHDVVYDLELALQFQFTPIASGKGYEGSTTIVDASWDIDSGILDRIRSRGLDDSVVYEDTTTINARELVEEFKIDCAR
ncbi:probable receptor-like protein kinase At2g23200 [Cucurbita moschata]|uniref:Probable receptor-like protein kinase At2g23200 n=1 Tax=Cucurbita moschata TaxID=3662 RepID=A0A6J1G7V9_CUCMO|nr:probable receptor-like protein kinase At2g23200 [Cucurbita moschata]